MLGSVVIFGSYFCFGMLYNIMYVLCYACFQALFREKLHPWPECGLVNMAVHGTLHTEYFVINSVYCTEKNASHYKLHTAHCTLYTAHFSLQLKNFSLHTARCKLHANNCMINVVYCFLHNADCIIIDTGHWTLHTEHC